MDLDYQGLSHASAAKLLIQHGKNLLPEKPQPGRLEILFSQIKSPLIYILLVAAIVTAVLGDYSDTIIIGAAVLLNTFLGYIQERKANSSLAALKKLVSHQAEVFRDGKRQNIDATLLVPGDYCYLDSGDQVPADGQIVWANRFFVDEAILTGESIPITKSKNGEIFMGTTIASGQAVFKVLTTGASTSIGKIASQVQEKKSASPLQRQLQTFSQKLVYIIVTLVVLVFIIGAASGINLADLLVTSVALAVSSIPEGLLVSLTVVLAIGMQRILARGGLVRNLTSAETLGSVTTICVDKTGTLTQGKMKVVEFIGDKHEIARQVVLANDLDDPLVIAASDWGKEIFDGDLKKHTRIDSIPFSSKTRYFASLHQDEIDMTIYVNGAPDILLEWVDLPDREKQKIKNEILRLTGSGMRLLGLAKKTGVENQKKIEHEDVIHSLKWVGLLAFSDPIRPGVSEAFNLAGKAGIKVIVITGDYPKTARFIMSEIGINTRDEEVIVGTELEKLTTDELAHKLSHIKLFARTTPDQKQKIVQALKDRGEIVAMTGDGVNDAPALHASDIGIAVGEASDSARESADLVLLDSNFSTIVEAIKEGRVMFENIRKIILYLMSSAFGEIILVMGSLIVGLPIALTATQILWINLVSDGLPNLALTVDPGRSGIMDEKPRSPREKLVNNWMTSLIVIISLVAGLLVFSYYAHTYLDTGDVNLARSVAFLSLGISSLFYAFSVRTLRSSFWIDGFFPNIWLTLSVAVGFVLQIIPFFHPGLRSAFGLTVLTWKSLLISLLLAAVMLVAIELLKRVLNKSFTR